MLRFAGQFKGEAKSFSGRPSLLPRLGHFVCVTLENREVWMAERFERHRQPWRQDEIQKLHTLASKGMALKAIAKALTRSEESVKDRAKLDRIKIAKLR